MSESVPTRKKSSSGSKKKCKLPPPPPDPPQEDFLVYLDNLQRATHSSYSRSTSTFLATEDAFDHLDKLYKLMEQMLELREQNVKLYRRVRDLEHLNNLEKMRRELDVNLDCPELDKDTAFAETILESIIADTKSKRLRTSSKKRNRSVSSPNFEGELEVRRASTCVDQRKKQAKISKWTKVKAAFKWEKAAVGEGKSQDSGIEGHLVEVARYLRVPSTSEDAGHSPADSGTAEIYTPATMSTASSIEDFHNESKSPCQDSSDEEHQTHSKEKSLINKHQHKTPWAKMKDIIQTRNSFKKKHRLSAQSDDIQIDIEPCSDNDDNVFEDEQKSDISPDIVERYQKLRSENQTTTRWDSVKKAFLEASRKPLDFDNNKRIEEEIQRNYKELQKKLSLEFQEKLCEWERMKQSSPNLPNQSPICSYQEESPSAFMKKMEEWQKIKSQPSIKKPQLQSEDHLPPEFRKKLQEWEKIRKTSCASSKKKFNEVPRWKSVRSDHSPTVEYPNLSGEFRKKLEEWKQIKSGVGYFDEDLSRYSKKHKNDYFEFGKGEKLERERQRFIEGEENLSKLKKGLKKEILVHTPSGFHRFEGISKKFTQKLYEWEKAKGIGPESSTFALLNSSLIKDNASKSSQNQLVRSKSADSIAISALNLTCPLMSQPSSLSLNNVEDLEKDCLDSNSKSSSLQSRETLQIEEPEALIVEVEDIVEETAAPLKTYKQRVQQPIYQREELKSLCEGETCKRPKVRRSESTRAQNNYDLIEDVFNILQRLADTELEIQKTQDSLAEEQAATNTFMIKLKMYDEIQKTCCKKLSDKISQLQEANTSVMSNITQEMHEEQIVDVVEVLRDISSEVHHLRSKLTSELLDRNVYELYKESGARCLNPVIETVKEIRTKMLDLRRNLSYLCAASDVTVPNKKTSTRLYVKSDNVHSQGAIKKRIKYRQKSRRSPDTDEDEEVLERRHRKVSRSKSIHNEEIDGKVIEKIVIPTKTNLLELKPEDELQQNDTPLKVFVKTTRKFFSPVAEAPLTPQIIEETVQIIEDPKPVTQLPPTPTPQRKMPKEISPAIRYMLNKYNQKINEDSKSGSSGSASPVAWRSPSFERRVRIQTERYQEGLIRVEKSASASFLNKNPEVSIAKSSSASAVTKLTIPTVNEEEEDTRVKKLQKAKEEFFRNREKPQESEIKFPSRNRLSQISVGSESSYDSAIAGALVKSASAGMISINADAFKQLEVHASSLPRSGTKKSNKFAFSNITSKFRKIKMRKGKESKMNAVSTLCRQSLVVDINHSNNNGGVETNGSKESIVFNKEKKDESEECGKTGWIRRQKLFRK